MSNFKRVLLLLSIGVVLLAGLIFTANTKVSTAHANGCNTVAEGYGVYGSYVFPNWGNTCTVSETQNSDSNAVYAIQLVLNESAVANPSTGKNCTVGNVDGAFGPNTFNGVECFQRGYNAFYGTHISVDGIVGTQTWGALANTVQPNLGLNTGWNYFQDAYGNLVLRMWNQSPYKWYVDAGGCWRQIDVGLDSCE